MFLSLLFFLCFGVVFGLSLSNGLSTPPSVATEAIFNFTEKTQIVYGQGLMYAGTPQQRVVNLTLDAFTPVQKNGGPPVPSGPRPAIIFVHGGGFMGSILDPDKAASIVDDVSYFVQRGFVGFQLNYRLAEDNGSFPLYWPNFPPVGGAGLGVQPGPIPIGSPMFESQRFKLGPTGSLSLANDDELCVHARAPGGSVQVEPCDISTMLQHTSDGMMTNDEKNDTLYWQIIGQSIIGYGGAFDGKCLTTQAPIVEKRAYVAKMAKDCNESDPSQHWEAKDFVDGAGGTLCHPKMYDGPQISAVDVGCLSFSGGFNPPVKHLYPAVRDVKAAVRWLRAKGAAQFNVDTSYITLDGGSAGACAILGAGLSQEPGDYISEVSQEEDPTLANTHLGWPDTVRSMIVHWGAPFAVDIATMADPQHRSRYHRNAEPSIIAYNGLIDTTIPIEHIREVQREYEKVNATIVVRALPNQAHACWNATVNVHGVTMTQSADAFDFIKQDQNLQPIDI